MSRVIKNSFERKQKATASTLCVVCLLLAGSFYSCDKTSPEDDNGITEMTMTVDLSVPYNVNSYNIELMLGGTGDVIVDWGDTSVDTFTLVPCDPNASRCTDQSYYRHYYSDAYKGVIKITGGNITHLRCYSTLSELDVSKTTSLKYLLIGHSILTSLDVSKNTALTYLFIHQNPITVLDLSKNIELTYLWISQTEILSLDLTMNTALTELYCDFNDKLTNLDLSKNIKLDYLHCSNNGFTNMDVSKNTLLTSLWCHGNQLTNLDVSNLSDLKVLICNDNKLTSLDLSKNTYLEGLYCRENQLTSLDVSKNIVLGFLGCQSNCISANALNDLFESLPNHFNSHNQKDILIEGNPGSADCNASIAVNKGWKVWGNY